MKNWTKGTHKQEYYGRKQEKIIIVLLMLKKVHEIAGTNNEDYLRNETTVTNIHRSMSTPQDIITRKHFL